MLRYALNDPILLLLWTLAILPAIVLHEFAHAAVAYRLGDPTPKYDGRLTLNPKALWIPSGPSCCSCSASGGHAPSTSTPITSPTGGGA